MPGTCESLEVTMSAISSWFLTRRIATKSNSPVTEYASATPGTSASAGPSLAIADRSASISTMAVTTKGILSPRSAELKTLDTTNICSYNGLVKMGVGGVSAKTSMRLEDLVTAIDEHLRRADEDVAERLPDLEDQLEDLQSRLIRMSRIRRTRRQLELRMWKSSPLFCKSR